jgi:succinoglycan biosynthesis transport protein ExoP
LNMPKQNYVEDDLEYEGGKSASGMAHRQRSMRDYFHWIARRAWLVVLTTVAGLILGIYIYKQTPESYQSRATIQVDRQESVERLDSNDQELRLSGEAFVNTIAQKFSLPKFYQQLAEQDSLHQHPNILPDEFSFFAKNESEQAQVKANLTPAELGGIMPEWVKAVPAKGSNLLDVIVTHTDPEICEIVANGVIAAYQRVSNDEMRATSNDTVKNVTKTLGELRTSVGTLSMRKAGYTECLETKELIDQTELKIAQMSTRYGPKWPPFIEVQKLGEQLREKFMSELGVVKSSDAEERDYWMEVEQKQVDPVDRLQPRVALLVNLLAAAENRIVNMDQTMQQAQLDTTEGNEFTVQRAAQRGYQTGPKPLPIIGKFTFAGGALGVGIILLLGFLDPSARTVADLEGLFDVAVLGAIPQDKSQLKSRKGKRRSAPKILTDHSAPAEAVRNLRAGLSFLGSSADRRSFLFTSAMPGEGKSWVSANLAAAFGAQGDRTLMIDLDLRKPTQHRIFGIDRSPGVSDFLTQGTPLRDVFRKTDYENLYLISAGTQSPNPSELLTAENLKRLMDSIPPEIDRIIIDTAPVLAVRDSLAPAKLVDSTIVVFKMAKTPIKALDRLLRVMDDNHTLPVGIVANSLPNSRKKGYGYYGDYYYGYHGSGEYYGEELDDEDDNGNAAKVKRRRQEEMDDLD